MAVHDYMACKHVLDKLRANEHAIMFLRPVNPVIDGAPDYPGVVKEPMDLRTMGIKLQQGAYQDRAAFKADFLLIIGNAKLYNPVGTFVYNEAICLEAFFEKEWAD
ncbi:Bromodomain-containing protein [Coprinopsis sp. MPI-PUGE-AT-0042]|nr:Bromodomain-containing protein [Coprinopsis sp. MPI-PUGE-AT-0042]